MDARNQMMTAAQYDFGRAKVSDAEGLRQLFRRSGWAQAKNAAKEGRSQQWVSRVLARHYYKPKSNRNPKCNNPPDPARPPGPVASNSKPSFGTCRMV